MINIIDVFGYVFWYVFITLSFALVIDQGFARRAYRDRGKAKGTIVLLFVEPPKVIFGALKRVFRKDARSDIEGEIGHIITLEQTLDGDWIGRIADLDDCVATGSDPNEVVASLHRMARALGNSTRENPASE